MKDRKMTNEEIIKGLQATNEHIGKHFNENGAWMAEFIDNAIKALESQLKTIQEKQAESEKYEKAFDDGYNNGYAQARFDYEPQQKIDEIIKRIEETRDKDKIAEYPYNKCIKIVKDVLENDKL